MLFQVTKQKNQLIRAAMFHKAVHVLLKRTIVTTGPQKKEAALSTGCIMTRSGWEYGGSLVPTPGAGGSSTYRMTTEGLDRQGQTTQSKLDYLVSLKRFRFRPLATAGQVAL